MRLRFATIFLIFIMTLSACATTSGNGGTVADPGGSEEEDTSAETEYDPEELQELADAALMNDSYLLEDLSSTEERIILKSLSTKRRYRFAFGMATKFLDKWGNRTSQSDFVRGSIVKIGKAVDNVLTSIALSKDAWIVEDLNNFSYDEDREVFRIGKTKYRMRPDVNVFSGDLTVTMADVTDKDRLRVEGIGKEVYSVAVTTGHGNIALMNTDFFKDSMISIGTKIYMKVTKDTTVPVSAGKYKVTVAKDGYGGSTTVRVKKNQTVTIDLNTLKGKGPKKCKLIFRTTVKHVSAYLDGKKVKLNKKIKVDYGEHRLRVLVKDYEPWEKTLLVNSPTAEISLDPEEDESDSSSGNANSGNSGNGNANNSNNSNANNGNANNSNNNNTNNGNNSNNNSNNSNNNNSSTNNNTNNNGTNDSNSSGNGNNANNSGNSSNSSSSSSSNGSNNSSSDSSRQAELDYLDTLSNMIEQLTGAD
ncbi:MAG: hypothetical protein IJ682_02020 [Lachnospiraceae bacterium]|nr:hypothetical protein [Lachnospiraceae bacterium]